MHKIPKELRMYLFLWAVMLVFFSLEAQLARAHSWYPWECCSELDCYPVPVAREHIERRENGWFLKKEQITIPFDMARVSPDRFFHLCRDEMGKGRLITPTGKQPCLWVPEGDG